MNVFFADWDEVEGFLQQRPWMRCPYCGAVGALGRHGFILGYVNDRGDFGVRARRIRCRPKKGGCGKTWSLRPGDRLFRYCFGTQQAWRFLSGLMQKQSIKAA